MSKRFLICAASLFSLANLAMADNYGPFSCQFQNNCAGHNWNASAFNGGTQVGQTTSGGVPVMFNVVSPSVLTVNAGGRFIGSLLAPFATFTGNTSVDGQLLIATWNNPGEMPDQYFDGSLDALLVATPEPSTWMMFLGCGLLLYNLFSKRFSSKKQ